MTLHTEEAGEVVRQYVVESQWAGWWGGYGDERLIEDRLNSFGQEGWRLVRTERIWAWWFWLILRPKLLYVFERAEWEDVTEDDQMREPGA